ncbi:hypothetical protein [Ilumatobacter sp.]|uniref:hypothetical protein n=1 Tax=Ilumatobacter sp. TaxID=1967498 RepID=UPI003AF4C8F7
MQTPTRETHAPERAGPSRKWLVPLVAMLAVVGITAGLWAIPRSAETDDQRVATELGGTWMRSGADEPELVSPFR